MTALLTWMIAAAAVSTERLCSVGTLRENGGRGLGYTYTVEQISGMVKEAELIVRVVALTTDSVVPVERDNRGMPSINFGVIETLRGELTDGVLRLPGRTVPNDDFNQSTVPYGMVRSAGTRGDCYASEYRLGGQYLLLLKRGRYGLTPWWMPLAPVNEQIRGSDDPWLHWVRSEITAGLQPQEKRVTRATGTFEVKLNPQGSDPGTEGTPLARLSIDKQFFGDLQGTSKGEMLSAGTPVPGSAGYVAIERVSATLAGKRGSFVLQHTGTMNRGAPELTVTVVPDSGTGELAGISGRMTIRIEGGKHFYEFEYSFAEKR